MKSKLAKLFLDQRGKSFIDESLDYAGTFGMRLKEQNRGIQTSWTLLPAELKQDDVYSFWTGSPSKICPSSVADIFNCISEYLLEYLSMSHENVIVMSNWIADKSDPWIKNDEYREDKIFFFESEVYILLNFEDQRKIAVENALKLNSELPFSNVFLTTFERPKMFSKVRGQIDSESLIVMVKNTKSVVAIAYDAEGYIVFEYQGMH